MDWKFDTDDTLTGQFWQFLEYDKLTTILTIHGEKRKL